MSRIRRAINFDLDTKALKEFYPGKDYRAAYGEIKNFMENNGFNDEIKILQTN